MRASYRLRVLENPERENLMGEIPSGLHLCWPLAFSGRC